MKDALTREKLGKAAWKLLLVLAGNTLYALAVALFVLPNGLITGGTTGLGLAAQYFFGLPLSAFVGAVSYTHLKEVTADAYRAPEEAEVSVYIPVSYPHLDVYKRQECGRTGCPAPGPRCPRRPWPGSCGKSRCV